MKILNIELKRYLSFRDFINCTSLLINIYECVICSVYIQSILCIFYVGLLFAVTVHAYLSRMLVIFQKPFLRLIKYFDMLMLGLQILTINSAINR